MEDSQLTPGLCLKLAELWFRYAHEHPDLRVLPRAVLAVSLPTYRDVELNTLLNNPRIVTAAAEAALAVMFIVALVSFGAGVLTAFAAGWFSAKTWSRLVTYLKTRTK